MAQHVKTQDKKHTISVLVENHFGVLARVSGMFSARGFNIISLCVGETEDPIISRMTVVVRGDDSVLAQLTQQLKKLIEVIEVIDLTTESFVERELVLLRVSAKNARRRDVIEVANIFRAKAVDIGASSMIFEVTGAEEKVAAFIDTMRPFGVQELVRTGEIAISRSSK